MQLNMQEINVYKVWRWEIDVEVDKDGKRGRKKVVIQDNMSWADAKALRNATIGGEISPDVKHQYATK